VIRNFLTAARQAQESSHGGDGPVDLYEVWSKDDFESAIDFFDRVVVKPGSTVGTHRHGDNEEMYVILSGTGTMTIDGTPTRIKAGDMILNRAGGEHGLVNDSDADIDILVLQVALHGKDGA